MFLPKTVNYSNFDFSKDYYQVFRKPFNNSISPQVVIKLKIENQVFVYDIAIAEFLFNVRFATINQINRFFVKWLEHNKNILSEYRLSADRTSRLYSLEDYRIVNDCLISDNEKAIYEENPDYLKIYTLDLGGKGLVANFTDFNYWDWKYTDNVKDPRKIMKELVVTDIYLKLLETNLLYFSKNTFIYQGKNSFVPEFKATVKSPTGKNNCFYGEIIFKGIQDDKLMDMLLKYESLLSTNMWKKFSEETPVVLFFVEDINTAVKVCQMCDKYLITNYRLSTFEDIRDKSLIDGFYKYNGQKKLQRVKSSHFALT